MNEQMGECCRLAVDEWTVEVVPREVVMCAKCGTMWQCVRVLRRISGGLETYHPQWDFFQVAS